jgi:hypothetical protein
MTSRDVRELLESEINGDWSRSNGHACDLRRCLVNPEKRPYQNSFSGGIDEFWLVLEEEPETRSGYKIIYDEGHQQYGLACPGFSGQDVFIGWYGSFWDSFEGM